MHLKMIIFECIFLYENFGILINFSLKFVRWGPIDSKLALVQVIAWHKTGDNLDSKIHGANVGPTWGRQDPGGPHIGHMNFAIWEAIIWTSYDSIWLH